MNIPKTMINRDQGFVGIPLLYREEGDSLELYFDIADPLSDCFKQNQLHYLGELAHVPELYTLDEGKTRVSLSRHYLPLGLYADPNYFYVSTEDLENTKNDTHLSIVAFERNDFQLLQFYKDFCLPFM